MNAVVQHQTTAVSLAQTANEVRAHVNRIQEVMQAVFKENVHYGRIPGAGDKPALFKPGAEVICTTFRIAPEFRVDDLGGHDEVRYRVTCIGRHQTTGIALGEGTGEASTNEEKYKWRQAVCEEEFEATDMDRRRVKYARGKGGGHYTVKQIRTNPADLANTVLKMACKRALVAMCLITTAASDCFAQDIEDMPEELRGAAGGEDEATARRTAKPATKAPQARPAAAPVNMDGAATEKQVKLIRTKLSQAGMDEEDFCRHFAVASVDDLPFAKVNDALAYIADPQMAGGEDDRG
jgi:hypothetical protein